MSKAIVLLWLGTGSPAAFDADLDGWARARFARLEAPPADAPEGLAYDEAIVQAAEESIEQARIAAASLDVATATKRLAETDELVRKHPELPQAAWLMAERLRVEA